MGKDINDLDYTLGVFNGQNENVDNIEDVIDKSINCKAAKDKRMSKEKPRGIKELAKKTIIIACIGSTLITGANTLYNAGETFVESFKLSDELGKVVSENTYATREDVSQLDTNWVYKIKDIAYDTLNTHKEYDIDTRIYGCYNKLCQYKQESCMDQVFEEMNDIILSNPEGFTQDELRACTFRTFKDYLASKNLTLDEYKDYMRKIVKGYVLQNNAEENVEYLINQMNDVERSGGSR